MEKFDQLISDERYKSLSPVDQYDVRRRFFHKVAGDERFSQLPENDQRDIGQRILFKGTENEAPGFFEGVKRAFTSGVQATGQHLVNVYESLDPTKAPSMLQAGVGPLLAGLAVTPPAIGGEFAGEVARKSAEQLGASPEVQATIGTVANIAVPGGFVPQGVRGARSRAGGPLTTENIKPGAKEAPAAPAGPSIPPEIRARAEAIEQQLLEAERMRRSPQGGALLKQELAAEEAKGVPARQAGMQLEQDVAASDIEGGHYLQGLGPKRGVGPTGAPIRPQDDAMAIMRGEEGVAPPPAPNIAERIAQLEADNAKLREMQAPSTVKPQGESVIPEARAPVEPAKPQTALSDDPAALTAEFNSTTDPVRRQQILEKLNLTPGQNKTLFPGVPKPESPLGVESVAPKAEIPALPPEGNLRPEAPADPAVAARIAELEAESVKLRESLGIKTPKPKAPPQPRAKLEDTEVAISTLIKRRGGINIPKNLKEEFGGWNRLHNKTGMAADEFAHEAYDLGMIERPDTNALIEGLKAGKKSTRMLGAEAQDALVVGVEADRHVKALQDAPAGVEYKGKDYDAVVPEKGGAVRLKDDPDIVLKKPSDILQVEEKIPFDVPEEKAPMFERTAAGQQAVIPGAEARNIPEAPLTSKRAQTEAPMELEQPAIRAQEPGLPLTKAPADLRPAIRLADGETIVGDAGKRHDSVMAKMTEAQKSAIQESGWVGPEGKFMSPDEATEYKFRNASNTELIKQGFGSETGAVGKLDEGMQQIEADARAARKELYTRLYNYSREKGVSLKEAARDHNMLQRDMARLSAEADAEKWQPSEAQRQFTPLEKEIGTSSENPRIFEPIPEEFTGARLTTPVLAKIKEAAIEAYKASGKKLDPDIPVTIQIVRDFAEGNIKLTPELAKYEKEIGDALAGTESNAGKALNQVSQLKRALQKADTTFGDFGKLEPPSGWEYAGDMFSRWVNIWRGALVTQLGTAVRNMESQAMRVGIDGIEKATDGVLQKMFRLGDRSETALSDGFRRAIEGFVDLAKKGKREQANEILTVFPNQKTRLFYQYASDVNAAIKEPHPLPAGTAGKIAAPFERMTQSAEKAVEFANVLNRGQEFLIRKAAFRAKLADLLEKSGQNIDSIDPRAIDEKMIGQSVDHALEMTFAVTPQQGIGKRILDVYRLVPPLYFVAPFPKFMMNSMKFFADYSPAGFLKLLSSKERAAIAAGNTKTLSRAIIGTGLLGAAYGLRNSEYAGDKWYELQIGDKTIDTRPYNPFASYMFVADVVNKMRLGTLDKLGFREIAQGLLSTNFRAGAGLFMLDSVGDFLGGVISNEGADAAKKGLKRVAGETLAGFLMPLQTFRDILSDERLLGLIGQEDFAKAEGTMRDVRDKPFLGPMQAKIPGLSQSLPQTQFPIGGDAEREEPALRQLTGVMLRTKTPTQHEADRLGLGQRDLLAPTGIEALDRKTAEIMRPVAERTLTTLMSSRAYTQADDLQKRIWFRKWTSEIGNQARKAALSQNPELRIEYVIKKAGKDQGKQLREMYTRRGLIASE